MSRQTLPFLREWVDIRGGSRVAHEMTGRFTVAGIVKTLAAATILVAFGIP
jgi:hypothetical protein